RSRVVGAPSSTSRRSSVARRQSPSQSASRAVRMCPYPRSVPAILDGLTDAQREAVTHPPGRLLVVAGAGTGKTSTLVARFAWLVEQGTPPDGILVLTFSAPAADELRARLEAAVERPYEELSVSTFHAFCARLLRDEAIAAGLDPFATPVTPADRLAL